MAYLLRLQSAVVPHASARLLPLPTALPAAVHAGLLAPGSGYELAEVAEAVRHTPAQVRTLLGVV